MCHLVHHAFDVFEHLLSRLNGKDRLVALVQDSAPEVCLAGVGGILVCLWVVAQGVRARLDQINQISPDFLDAQCIFKLNSQR
jgi:hypothetical protein